MEIICIAPWQIENLKLSIDIFYNAHSFVEMTPEIVSNYAAHIEKLPHAHNTKIILVSYDRYNLETTLDPDHLKSFFTKNFQKIEQDMLPGGERKNFIYVGA